MTSDRFEIDPDGREIATLSPEQEAAFQPLLRVAQTIGLPLILGPLLMLLISFVLGGMPKALPDTLPFLFVAGGMAVFEFMALPFILSSLRSQAPPPPAESDPSASSFREWFGGWQTRFIVRSALFEGVALLSAIFNLIDPAAPFIVIALAMLAAIAVRFPTRRQVLNDLQDDRDRLAI